MRAPLSWLAEYVDLPTGTTVEEIDAALVRMGLEVDDIHRPGEGLTGPVVIGRVLEVEDLTEFKKPIRWNQVDVGEAEPAGIVCGASNYAVGDLVAVARPGAVLPGGFAISARKTYGKVSDGMICSARELGLGDDHTGILVLGDELGESAVPGADAIGLLGLDDVVFELNITPDRGYALSIRGVGRDLALGLKVGYRDPADDVEPLPAGEPPYDVRVEDPVGCDRFVAGAVTGIDPDRPSPLWMRRRLWLAGIRSISLAVDVTNYVMLELGQPMHAFDRNLLSGPIVVRRASAGEKLRTLDGVDRVLDATDMLITDDSGPIGLAAVMGGETTEIAPSTTDVLLEAAHWAPLMVAATARRHKLSSEAARRFERGVDPDVAPLALARSAQLLAKYAGGTIHSGVLDVDNRLPRTPVRIDAGLPERVIGVPLDRKTVIESLVAVGSEVDEDGDELSVLPASWRPDITDPYDLVEEVARVYGYDEVPSVLPTAPPGRGIPADQRRRRSIGRALAEAGYVEAPAYPFVSPEIHDTFRLDADDPRRTAVRLANPLSDTEPEMRTSLLPGLLRTLERNLGRGSRNLAIFELGLVVNPDRAAGPAPLLPVDRRPTDAELATLFAAVPHQPWHVGVVLSGQVEPAGWWGAGREATWADAVEAARTVAAAAGVELTVRRGARQPWHPGRCAELVVLGTERVVGYAGELHPGVLQDLDLPPRVSAMELDLDLLPLPEVVTALAISTYPPTLVDVAVVVEEQVPAAEVESALVAGAGDLLEQVKLFDVYAGAQVGEGRKSLAYALTFRAPDRTMTIEEATAARDAAVAEASRRTGAVIRGA